MDYIKSNVPFNEKNVNEYLGWRVLYKKNEILFGQNDKKRRWIITPYHHYQFRYTIFDMIMFNQVGKSL